MIYGFEPLGLSWKNRGVDAAAPAATRIAIVAALPSPKRPPPPSEDGVGGVVAPVGVQLFRVPPATASLLLIELCSLATSPAVPLLAFRVTHPVITVAFAFPCSKVSITLVLGLMSSDPSGPRSTLAD